MKCFVTGATGFIGAHLVRELVQRGHAVRALVRPGRNPASLRELGVECLTGDVTEPDGWRSGLRGCDWCFHVAASYHLWLADYRPMYHINVEGTRRVLEAAAAADCSRIVHTSTVGCVGLPCRARDGSLEPSDESATATEGQMITPYKRSKWQAEQLALQLADRGSPVILVHPTAPIGPGDARPTPTGQVVLDFLRGRMPGYVEGGLNWVHVRDVAAGHVLAAEKGQVGARYILGHTDGNWTIRRTFEVLAEIAGQPAPRLRVPYAAAYAAACLSEAASAITRQAPRVPLAGVRMSRHPMWYNPARAIRELGLPQTPLTEAFRESVEWYRSHGYVPD